MIPERAAVSFQDRTLVACRSEDGDNGAHEIRSGFKPSLRISNKFTYVRRRFK
jgi:hypothetical protein